MPSIGSSHQFANRKLSRFAESPASRLIKVDTGKAVFLKHGEKDKPRVVTVTTKKKKE